VIIEYKHGKPKIGHEDEVQLCAQALCLEEMLGITLPSSSFFYGQPRRRYDVDLNEELRRETEALVTLLHELTISRKTPEAEFTSKCQSCSLVNICLPKVTRGRKTVSSYITRMIKPPEETHETPA
jgi:CRISPR-associated exonuclease Cas4